MRADDDPLAVDRTEGCDDIAIGFSGDVVALRRHACARALQRLLDVARDALEVLRMQVIARAEVGHDRAHVALEAARIGDCCRIRVRG
jgi:hypothetical protein